MLGYGIVVLAYWLHSQWGYSTLQDDVVVDLDIASGAAAAAGAGAGAGGVGAM